MKELESLTILFYKRLYSTEDNEQEVVGLPQTGFVRLSQVELTELNPKWRVQ